MSRRFLHLISRATKGGIYSINRMDTSQLFNSSTAVIAKDCNVRSIEEIPELEPMPAATFRFQAYNSNMYHVRTGMDVFSSLGEHKVLCADGAGYTVAYDIKSHAILGMPRMNAPKGPMHMSVSSIPRTEDHALTSDSDWDPDSEEIIQAIIKGDHTESIYVMDLSPRNPVPFEVLTFSTRGWIWRPLPCPQFFRDPKYKPSWHPCTVVVDGTTIYLSPTTTNEEVKRIGTYCFDTVTQEWEKAGDWVLPFLGKAEFLPEFGLWLGISPNNPHQLCTVSSLDPPMVKSTFPDPSMPEDWLLMDQTLCNLGCGRFCTVKFFAFHNDYDTFHAAVIFTGMEVVRYDDGEDGNVKVIRHLSRRVTHMDICSVL